MAHHGAASDAHPPVARVFVFDDRLGRGEGAEHEKLLGVFPSSTARDECAAAVGLAQGLTGFLAPFADARAETPRRAQEGASSSTEPSAEPSPRRSLVLAADARRVACLECEPHIWWLLSVDARAAPERDVRDAALLRMLADAHEDYELVHGSVQSALSLGTRSLRGRKGSETEENDIARRVHQTRRRLAPFVAALGESCLESLDKSDFSSKEFHAPTDKRRNVQKRDSKNALTHARDDEPLALANPRDPSAFVETSREGNEPDGEPAERDFEEEKGNLSREDDRAANGTKKPDLSPRRVASRVLDTVASALRRRGGCAVAESAAVYHAADGSCRAAAASSRAMARFAAEFRVSRDAGAFWFRFATECGSSEEDAKSGWTKEKKNTSREISDASIDSCAFRIGLEASAAMAALRGFGLGSEKTSSGPAAKETGLGDDERNDDADLFSGPDESISREYFSDEDEETFLFAFADADPNAFGVAVIRVADGEFGDAATFAWTLTSNDDGDGPDDFFDRRRVMASWRETIANEISKLRTIEDKDAALTTDVEPPSCTNTTRILRASLESFRALYDAERRASRRAVETGAFQPHAFVSGDKNERLAFGCVARAYPEDDFKKNANRQRSERTSSATTRAVSLARAELDAFRRERDQNEFPIESCHRASHDAWVAFRGADFFSNEKETKEDADGVNGSFVVSVAEGSSATLLEASARADACLRQAAYF